MSSRRAGKFLSLAGIDLEGKSLDELRKLYKQYLENGLHGLFFSPYEEGQEPVDQLSEEQIRRRMDIIKPYTNWIRSFSTTDGNEMIPVIAKEYGIKTLVGAWLGDDPEINEREIQGLIKLVNDGMVDIAAVGNEVMYRKDLTEQELLDFMYRVKDQVKIHKLFFKRSLVRVPV